MRIKSLKFLTLRPEVRVDYGTSAHSRPFDDSFKRWAVTIGADTIIAFQAGRVDLAARVDLARARDKLWAASHPPAR